MIMICYSFFHLYLYLFYLLFILFLFILFYFYLFILYIYYWYLLVCSAGYRGMRMYNELENPRDQFEYVWERERIRKG